MNEIIWVIPQKSIFRYILQGCATGFLLGGAIGALSEPTAAVWPSLVATAIIWTLHWRVS